MNLEFPVLDQRDKRDFLNLKRIDAELTRSLRHCHLMIVDDRAHLAPANSNVARFIVARTEDETERSG